MSMSYHCYEIHHTTKYGQRARFKMFKEPVLREGTKGEGLRGIAFEPSFRNGLYMYNRAWLKSSMQLKKPLIISITHVSCLQNLTL